MLGSGTNNAMAVNHPQTTVILAMTADGKISDQWRSPARFGSRADKAHLEHQIAQMDAVLFGAETLRAYGSSLVISNSDYLEERRCQGKPPQPIQIVCSQKSDFDARWRFFQQPFPRWLLTPQAETQTRWQKQSQFFERILLAPVNSKNHGIDWSQTLAQLKQSGIKKLGILGGSQLITSLFTEELLDFLWLTVCPFWVGGATAPTPLGGVGLSLEQAQCLDLLAVKQVENEVFLHYQFRAQTLSLMGK